MGGKIENNTPMFSYHLEVQEFDAKEWISGKPPEGEEVEKDRGLMMNTYRIELALHDEPDIEVTGHYWKIVEFMKIGEVKLLAWIRLIQVSEITTFDYHKTSLLK